MSWRRSIRMPCVCEAENYWTLVAPGRSLAATFERLRAKVLFLPLGSAFARGVKLGDPRTPWLHARRGRASRNRGDRSPPSLRSPHRSHASQHLDSCWTVGMPRSEPDAVTGRVHNEQRPLLPQLSQRVCQAHASIGVVDSGPSGLLPKREGA